MLQRTNEDTMQAAPYGKMTLRGSRASAPSYSYQLRLTVGVAIVNSIKWSVDENSSQTQCKSQPSGSPRCI